MTSVEPVRKEIVVHTSQERAFEVFTGQMERWWPKEHHVGTAPLARTVLEPRVGGAWYAICEDGSRSDTGKVLAWDPPHRVVLAWQLAAGWSYDPSFMTEVEVTFVAEGPRRTRVQLEHRNLERYGAAADDLRRSIDADGGWMLGLRSFARVAEQDAAASISPPA
jgi:uncharacterized protein YndB with AHSA1/START domain